MFDIDMVFPARMPTNHDADKLIYDRLALHTLPEWCAQILDSRVPLPADVVYFAHRLECQSFLAAIVLPFFFGRKQPNKQSDLSKASQASHIRLGLFLTSDALLLGMAPDYCTLIPKSAITRIEVVSPSLGQFQTRGSLSLRIHYQTIADRNTREQHLDIPIKDLQASDNAEKLLRQVRHWHNPSAPESALQVDASPASRRKGPRTPDEIREERRQAWQEQERMRIEQERQLAAGKPKPRKIPPILNADGIPKSCWEVVSADHSCGLALNARGEVSAWETWPGHPIRDGGGSVTFAEFLNGQYQDLAKDTVGMDSLEEILASIHYLLAHPELIGRL